MIEGDINERMARFAPSQNVDPVLDVIRQRRGLLPPSSVAPSFAEMPDIAQPEGPDPIVDMLLDRRKERLNSTLYGAMRVDPDQAARAQKLAPDVGVGADMVMRHLPDMERQARLADIERRRLYMNDPVLSTFLEQKEFAEVAHDDIGVLDAIRPIMQDWATVYWTGATPGMRRGFERGQLVAERGDIGAKAMTGFAGPEDFDRAKQVELRMRELTDIGFLGATTEVMAQNLAQLRGIGTATVGGAAIGSVVPVIGTISGAGLGATAGVMATTAQMEAGNLYLDLREQGVSDDTAIPTAIAGGYLNGIIEVVGMKIAAKPFQALAKRMIAESVAKAVAQPTVRGALATAGKAYFLQVGAEGTEESLQEIVIIAGEEVAKAIDSVDTETSMAQAMDRVVDAFTQGAMGAAILGGIGPGANLYVDMRRAATTQRQQDFFQRLSETSKESRLAQRSPDAYERFLEAQAKGGPAETIYVDARVAQQVFAQSGLTPQQLEEVLPGIRAQIETEVATGGDVTIQTARFGARLANTDLGNALLPHMRLDPDAMSVTEAQEFNARRQETVREAEQILAQKQEADGSFVAEARDIEDTLAAQIVATGQMDEKAARTSAQFMRDFYVTQAAALGITPRQVYERFPVRVEGAMPAVATPLEQADQFDQAGQRRTDTPEFKAWSNNAQVIASERSEAHEFTTGKPVVVEALHGSTERGLRRFDVGRAVEVPGAIFFTSNPAVAEQYTYERAYGDIISDQPTGDVVRAYVAFANPMVYQPKGKVVDAIEMGRAIEQAKAAGHDGIIIKNIDDSIGMTGDMGDVYVTWNPTSIKSVDNRGTWSRETADIFAQAPVAPGFYSALEREVAAIDAKALTASGWGERFKGLIAKGAIKADELEWSGLADYLKMQEGKVSKDAVLEFLRGNGVRVERMTLGQDVSRINASSPYAIPEVMRYAQEFQGNAPEAMLLAIENDGDVYRALARRFPQLVEREDWAQIVVDDVFGGGENVQQARYEKYTLPGGTNYREVLLTLPLPPSPDLPGRVESLPNGMFRVAYPRLPDAMFATRQEADADLANKQSRDSASVFRSTHWDQPNVLVHLRMNDRVDADGKRVLFVEEVQSDWGQAGKKVGFDDPMKRDAARTALFAEESRLEELTQAWNASRISDPERAASIYTEAEAQRGIVEKLQDVAFGPQKILRAPFVETTDGWLNLGLKQVLLEAVRGNYDRVAFVTGQQSADRYDLSKQVERIEYSLNDDGTANISAISLDEMTPVIERTKQTQDQVADLVGKDIAKAIFADQGIEDESFGEGVKAIVGEDLKVGGEGMKSFYDKIVPIAMGKLLKKYGGGKIATAAINLSGDASANAPRPWDAEEIRSVLDRGGEIYAVVDGNEMRIRNAEELQELLDTLDGDTPSAFIYGDVGGVVTQPSFVVTPELVKKLESGLPLFQAAAGPARGGFDPKRLTTILTKTADLSTFLHESAHAFLTFYEQVAATPDAPARIVSDMDELLRWFKIDGATPAERLAKWNGLTLDQKRQYHETFAYNFEVYLFEGKAPSVEMQGLFERFSVWLKRVYRSIRDDLNAIYRREFGEDLPILTGEVRQIMDRMLATDEQIRRQAAINEMKPMFQSQEQSGMNDAEWAAYQAMQQEAIEAAVTDMNKASLRQMQWLGNARSRILKDIQRKHDRQRKEVAVEVAAAVRVEPVYRAMTYLRTGRFIDADGAEVEVEGPHRLDTKRVKAIYETVPTAESLEPLRATGMPLPTVVQPNLAKLGTGSGGMMGLDGLDPDLVAETFGYSSGDQLIRALVAARPIKEEIAARTDAEMLRRFGDMNTPAAVEAEVQAALHNEARARFVAVELRYVARATEPVRVMLDAAKQVARDLIAGRRVRDVRPSDFVAAEARAARDATRIGAPTNPVAIGQAAQTRAYNEAIAAGTDPAEAMVAAIEAGAEAARMAQERADALKAQYGAEPQQALIRAKRAQLYQNQLAAEALRVQDEVAKDIKYLRRVLRDENVKRMGAPAADQIAGLLERYEVAPVSLKRLDERRALTEWLAQQAELGLVPDIAPEIVNEARRVNYREVKVSEFRDLVDAIRQIEHIGKRERKAAQEKLRAEFDALKDEAIQSMKDVAAKRGRKARKELGDEDRKWAQLIAGYDAMQQTIGSIVYVLDGGQRDGPLARMLLFTANDAGNQETTDRADATLALSKILDPIERKGQFSGRKLYFPQIDDSLSLEQRMVVALNYGNQSNIDRLLNGEKWTEEQVQPILESLTEEQLNAVQAIWNYVESFKPRVAAQERNLLGREPNWIEPRPFTVRSADGKIVNMAGGYYPAKYNPRRSSMSREMDESVEADRQMREAITAATTTRSYTKNRLDKPPEGGVLSRQMGGLYAGVNEVIHDLAWRTWAMDANRLLRDKEFQTVINSIYGRETYAAIKNWVDATVRGERGNYDVIENIAIGVRRNVSVSAMGLKFITAAIQVTGLIPATVRTGITPMVRAVAYFAANPRESSRIAREKSSFMRNRGRTRYRDLNEIANIVRGESRARRAYLANAYALIGLQQGMVDMSVWWAAYSNAIKEGKAEEMAVSIADQTVIDTQGSGMLKDLSQAMRGGQKQSAYAKLFTSFYQFSNTQYALLSAQLRTAPSMGKAAADAFTILVVGAFIEEMLRTLLKPSPDDEEPEDLAKALIDNQIDFVIGLPFGGGELRGIGDMIVGEQAMQYRGPSGLRMVGEVRTFAGQTLQGEFDRAWTRSAINMSGLIWGIPSAQINDTIDGINAAVESEVEGAEAVLAPITGVRR